MTLQDPNMMPSSRLGCPLSLKTPNMGNIGSDSKDPDDSYYSFRVTPQIAS